MTQQPQQAKEIYPGVTIHPQILAGTPVISGTRVPVEIVLGHLASGATVQDVMANYDLTQEQIHAAPGYAADLVASEKVYASRASSGAAWRFLVDESHVWDQWANDSVAGLIRCSR